MSRISGIRVPLVSSDARTELEMTDPAGAANADTGRALPRRRRGWLSLLGRIGSKQAGIKLIETVIALALVSVAVPTFLRALSGG